MEKNKFFIILGVMLVSFLLFLFGNIFVDVVADRVIQKMTKEYCPSPYGPGVNPDKFDVNLFQKIQTSSNKKIKRADYPWE